MAINLFIGNEASLIGSPDFFYSFFSTICVRLENEIWGSVFPVTMFDFYGGNLAYTKAQNCLSELLEIREKFKDLPPDLVVWSFENRELSPPWGNKISQSINSLGNYFVTADGRQLFDVLEKCLKKSLELKKDLEIS